MPKTIRNQGGIITFYVTVPESTARLQRAVFLTGSLRQFSPNLPDWDPRGLPMQRVDDRHWTLTLMGQASQPNAVVEYKYTLGDWDHCEKDARCADIPNRRVVILPTASGKQAVHDQVEGWQGVD